MQDAVQTYPREEPNTSLMRTVVLVIALRASLCPSVPAQQKVAAAWSRSNFPPPALDTMFRAIEGVYRIAKQFMAKLNEIGPNPSSPKALGDLLMRWVSVGLMPTMHRQTHRPRCRVPSPSRKRPKLTLLLSRLSHVSERIYLHAQPPTKHRSMTSNQPTRATSTRTRSTTITMLPYKGIQTSNPSSKDCPLSPRPLLLPPTLP